MCPSLEPAGQSGGVNIPGTVGPVTGDIVGRDKITYGPTAEGIVDDLERRGLLVAAELAGLQRAVVIKLAQRLKPEALDFNQAVTELESAVNVALDVIARGERGTNLDAFINTILARVGERTKAGDFDGGARTVDEALAELDRREAEQRDLARRSRVALLEEGVKMDILRRDATAVARRIEMLVAVDHPTGRPAWLPTFRKRYDAFYGDGETKGINFSLSVAVELARRMVATAQDSSERGNAANLLGTALATLGARESGTARLEEAVAAYRAALEERTRKRVPLDWAATQVGLGSALMRLGERETGAARLEEAVAAYRAGLEERTRERVPLDWAATQLGLGSALLRLGERESGTARLEEAIAAYRAGLEERTRERVPLQWAATQVGLGSALMRLGGRESGTARLEEAVAAYRAALEERTRERVPLDWAETQVGLGSALMRLGEREGGTARLEEAVAAYRAALEERTRDRVPLDWAATRMGLGIALATLGERESGTARLEEAVAAFSTALEEQTRERVPLDWAATQMSLGKALRTLGGRRADISLLAGAQVAMSNARTIYVEEAGQVQYSSWFDQQLTGIDQEIAALGRRSDSTTAAAKL